jgi:hypothetical protein
MQPRMGVGQNLAIEGEAEGLRKFCEKNFKVWIICVREAYALLCESECLIESRRLSSPVMSSRLDACLEALRFLARSTSELEATRLMTAELRIREFLAPVESRPAALRASLKELDNAVIQETLFGPQEAASFWQGIRDFIAPRLAMLDDD